MFSPPRDPARPFVTFYDDATGERVELSHTSFSNWVAKTANLIRDGLGAAPGDRLSILLPAHWQTLVWLGACWEAGVVAAPGLDPAEADHVIAGPADLDRAAGCPGERVALALRPLGGRFVEPLAPGVMDYAAEVPAYGDRFVPYGVQPEIALLVDGRTHPRAEVVAAGRAAAATLGLDASSRLLGAGELGTWEAVRDLVLAPLAAGASLVLCRNLDHNLLPQRIASERITSLWLKGPLYQ